MSKNLKFPFNSNKVISLSHTLISYLGLHVFLGCPNVDLVKAGLHGSY